MRLSMTEGQGRPLQPDDPVQARTRHGRSGVLLVLVPGMGMTGADFDTQGLSSAVRERGWTVTIATVDPGPDAYLDGSVETRLLAGINEVRHASGADRVWLAGISLGCQAILRCVRLQPELAEGLILLTPYLASTGLIAEVGRTGGLRRWSAANPDAGHTERSLLHWLATASLIEAPRLFLGGAHGDRFAATTELLAALLPADQVVRVAGRHDWASWRALWGRVLDRNPFGVSA